MFETISVGKSRSAFHIVGVAGSPPVLPRGLDVTATERKALKAALETPGFKGNSGETVAAGTGHMLLALGETDSITTESLRDAAASLIRTLHKVEPSAVTLLIDAAIPARSVDERSAGQAFGEGLGIANWRVDFFDGVATKRTKKLKGIKLSIPAGEFASGIRDGLTTADAINEARRLGVTPPNIGSPKYVAAEARKLAKAAGLTCTVMTEAELKRRGMNGILNVGRGSDVPPNMIVLEHKPAKAKKGTTVAIVGKTMTYDSGGYSLKLSGGMKGMKYDGCGGYAVLGAMLAIAKLKLPVHVVALLPCAENMVNGEAYRPDDIITMYNGTSVEVTNTDAEGRLIMADALAYACEKYKPTAILDMATLTGGIVVALGEFSSGYFCNDDELCERIEDASDAADEKTWRMPLWESHRDFMRAKHADIWNSGPKRDGHPIQGAAFLSFFVDEDVPWAHIDIAGMADKAGGNTMYVPGPTGYGVRLLTEVVRGYAGG